MDEYTRLIEEFCVSIGTDDVEFMLHEGLIEMDAIPMRVEYVETGDLCRVVADLGEIPADHEEELRDLMLESNFGNDEPGFPVLSVHPETQHAVLALHLPVVKTLVTGGLMEAIDDYVMPIVEWWEEVLEADVSSMPEADPMPIGAFSLC